jgi:hypothetical protein
MTIDKEKFSDLVIEKLAKDSNLPPKADLVLFGQFVRVAAALYLEERAWATSAKIRADINAIRRVVRPINDQKKTRAPLPIIRALNDASPETLHLLKERAKRRGESFPTTHIIMDPARVNDAANILDALTKVGGSVKPGRSRPGGKRSQKYVVELYAPISQRNFAKQEAERAAINRLRVAWCAAARNDPDSLPSQVPATSASRENPGPFVRLVRGFFATLGVKADAVNLINTTDFERR